MAADKAQHLMTVYRVLGLGWGRSKGKKARGSGHLTLPAPFSKHSTGISTRECEAKDGPGQYQSEKDRAGGEKGCQLIHPPSGTQSPQIT